MSEGIKTRGKIFPGSFRIIATVVSASLTFAAVTALRNPIGASFFALGVGSIVWGVDSKWFFIPAIPLLIVTPLLSYLGAARSTDRIVELAYWALVIGVILELRDGAIARVRRSRALESDAVED